MGMYLDSRNPYESYKAAATGTYFVDKSALLKELIPALGTEERFFLHYAAAPFWQECDGKYDCSFFG